MNSLPNLVVSVSGGRTSMYMAIWIYANWSHLYNIIFVFANTGAEHEATLEFIENTSLFFDLPIVWVEAKVRPGRKGTSFTVVNFETASRNYEPFNAVVEKYGVANKSYRHCNRELKLAPIHSYACHIFGGRPFKNYETAIGIRVDEIDRMDSKAEKQKFIYPLIQNVPTYKSEILSWWKNQIVDLNLPEHYGNCKVCFKKSDRKLATISIEHPEWFDQMVHYEKNKSMIKVDPLLGEPRKIFRSHKTVSDIFAIAKDENFKMYIDGHYSDSLLEIDIDEPCGSECSM